MTRRRAHLNSLLSLAAFACALFAGGQRLHAQAAPTAVGPGSFISVGVAASGFQQDYGQHYVGGETLYVDANLYRRIGIEAEGRFLNYRTSESVKESTYLVGPRITGLAHNLRPYAKLLAGRGTLNFPFHYAVGHYFVLAPAVGVDYHLRNSRLAIRLIDVEYQLWPQFTFGELHPYGVSAGFSFDLFSPESAPRGRHFIH